MIKTAASDIKYIFLKNLRIFFYNYSLQICCYTLVIFFSCSDNEITSGDPDLNLPFFYESGFPDTLYSNTSVDFLASVRTNKQVNPDISYILLDIFDQSYSVLSADTLFDNASNGDIVPGDGVFSGFILLGLISRGGLGSTGRERAVLREDRL